MVIPANRSRRISNSRRNSSSSSRRTPLFPFTSPTRSVPRSLDDTTSEQPIPEMVCTTTTLPADDAAATAFPRSEQEYQQHHTVEKLYNHRAFDDPRELPTESSYEDEEPAELSGESTLVHVGQFEEDETEQEQTEESFEEYGPREVTVNEDAVTTSTEGIEPRRTTSSSSSSCSLLVLVTTMGMNRTQVQNQQRAFMMLNSKGFAYETVDGSDPANKAVRNELFRLSDLRGTYPQFFVVHKSTTTFLGDFETIEGINDSSGLPAEILEQNPTLLTWDRIPGLALKE